jgi:hypothetical protein
MDEKPFDLGRARRSAQAYPMGVLEMSGPFPLVDREIDRAVPAGVPGNYALGYRDRDTFIVFYVGRADIDLRARLREWVGAPSHCPHYAPSAQAPWSQRDGRAQALAAPALASAGAAVDSSYTWFACSVAVSAEAAFQKECRNYDDFGGARGLDNVEHPAELLARASDPAEDPRSGARIRIVRPAPPPVPWRAPGSGRAR